MPHRIYSGIVHPRKSEIGYRVPTEIIGAGAPPRPLEELLAEFSEKMPFGFALEEKNSCWNDIFAVVNHLLITGSRLGPWTCLHVTSSNDPRPPRILLKFENSRDAVAFKLLWKGRDELLAQSA